MNVCNYKEINALFALYKGVQLSQRCTNRAIGHQHYNPPTDCKKLLAQDILPQIARMCTD
jgi:hypothetical protein